MAKHGVFDKNIYNINKKKYMISITSGFKLVIS